MLWTEADLAPEERDRLLDRAAREIARRGLEVPAVFALEMHRPLTFLGSQALALFTPFLAPAFGLESLRKLYLLMEDRANLDRLIDRIEALAAGRSGARQTPENAPVSVVAVSSEPRPSGRGQVPIVHQVPGDE